MISEEASKASTPGETVLVCEALDSVLIPSSHVVNDRGPDAHVVGVDVLAHVLADLVADQTDVAAEVLGGQAELDKLLLLHQDVVGNIVDDLGTEDAASREKPRGEESWAKRRSALDWNGSKDDHFVCSRSSEVGVSLLRVDMGELSVQDKVGTERSEGGGDLASEERVGKHGAVLHVRAPEVSHVGIFAHTSASLVETMGCTHLCPAVVQEAHRIHTVTDGATEDGDIVENERRLCRVPRCDLK